MVRRVEADPCSIAGDIFRTRVLETGDPAAPRALSEMMRYQNKCQLVSIPRAATSRSRSKATPRPTDGCRAGDPRLGSLHASGFLAMAAWWSATPSPRCTSARWRTTTTRSRHPAGGSFYFPAGLLSTLQISSWSRSILCRWPSCTHASRQEISTEQDRRAFQSAAAPTPTAPAHGPRSMSLAQFLIILDRLMHWAEAVHIRPLRTLALNRRTVDA